MPQIFDCATKKGGVLKNCHTGLSGGMLLFATLAGIVPASAQTASQITPQTFAPPTQQPGGPVVIPEDMTSAVPAGADALEVRLAGVVVEDGTVDPAALAALNAQLVGRTVKVSEVFAAAHALEVADARAGRVLTRVVVPAQELADGATVRLVIVHGFIERIDTAGVPNRVAARVAAILAPLVGERDVTLAKIERKLLLVADVPGVRLTSTLAAGATRGATVLVIDAVQVPVSGFISLDNNLPDAVGRQTFGLGIDINAVLGLGEQIYLRASGLPNTGRETSFLDPTPRNRALAIGAIVPIGDDGLLLNVEATDARTAPRHDALRPGLASRFRRLSGRLRYPVIHTRALTLRAEASFDAQEERVEIATPVVLPLSLDQLRIARLIGDVVVVLPDGGVLTGRVQGSFGIDGLGARTAKDATATLPLSRQGTDAGFQTLEVRAALEQPLFGRLGMGIRARALTGFGQVLANSEQSGIATADGISPLPSGSLQGDSGHVVRAEVRARLPLAVTPAFVTVTPYGFGAVGGVAFQRPTVLERRRTDAAAWGVGVRFTGVARDSGPGLSASVEYGAAHVDGAAGHPTRVSFTLAAQF